MTIDAANRQHDAALRAIDVSFALYLSRTQEAQGEFLMNTNNGQQKIAAASLEQLRQGFRKIAAEMSGNARL